jgi:hypothetical protein
VNELHPSFERFVASHRLIINPESINPEHNKVQQKLEQENELKGSKKFMLEYKYPGFRKLVNSDPCKQERKGQESGFRINKYTMKESTMKELD